MNLKAHTRFGKSLTVALAVLTRCITFPEKWAIVAPTATKAKIIMGYIIDHIFDNPLTEAALEFDRSEGSIRRLQQERSKTHLSFRIGKTPDGKPLTSEVFIVSADNRNKLSGGDSAMGLGAPNVVLDEASLIDDDIEAKIFRMLGDSMENFYLKIGNPFKRNHFMKSDRDPAYHKMNIDYLVGISEGRLNEEFVAEARKKPHFGVLYENKFPEADTIDSRGYTPLITDSELERAFAHLPEEAMIGMQRLSVDVARGGGNFNTYVRRCDNYATLLAKSSQDDTMEIATTTICLAREHNVSALNTFIDDNGVGGGVTDRLRQLRFFCRAVKASESPDDGEDSAMFINRRAQNYWRLRKWILDGGKLDERFRDEWAEILSVKYKATDTKKIQIMPKLMMAREGIESPDVADALAQSFDMEHAFDPREEETTTFDPSSLI